MKVVLTENKPIKMWLDEIEDGAMVQAINLANLPFLYKHVASRCRYWLRYDSRTARP